MCKYFKRGINNIFYINCPIFFFLALRINQKWIKIYLLFETSTKSLLFLIASLNMHFQFFKRHRNPVILFFFSWLFDTNNETFNELGSRSNCDPWRIKSIVHARTYEYTRFKRYECTEYCTNIRTLQPFLSLDLPPPSYPSLNFSYFYSPFNQHSSTVSHCTDHVRLLSDS